MSSITITVPLDYFALTRASDMLHGLALDLEKRGEGPKSVPDPDIQPVPTDATPATPNTDWARGTGPRNEQVDDSLAEQEEKDASTGFGSQPGKPAETATEQAITTPSASGATAPAAPTEQTSPSADSPNEPAEPAPAAASPGTASEATAPHGVELDSAGLPWDSRIHAGSKGKLAKTKQWKKKRGVDQDLVDQVEAELRAAMSASPANPVEAKPTTAPAPAPTTASGPAPAPTTASGPAPAPTTASGPAPAPAAATGAITSFPALMQRITAAGIAQADVTAAVNKQGLQALPLLAARPDLIPAVAAELFPGG